MLEETQVVTEPTRFVGLDVHRRYATVAAVDTKQHLVLTARRIDFDDFEEWTRKHLRRTDAVTPEATSNAWHLYDMLVPLVASVTVANPMHVALIAKTRVKTDPRDALTLARLLAAGGRRGDSRCEEDIVLTDTSGWTTALEVSRACL